jgi:hypothetical protein
MSEPLADAVPTGENWVAPVMSGQIVSPMPVVRSDATTAYARLTELVVRL